MQKKLQRYYYSKKPSILIIFKVLCFLCIGMIVHINLYQSLFAEIDGKMKLKYKCHTTRKLEAIRSCLQPKEGKYFHLMH